MSVELMKEKQRHHMRCCRAGEVSHHHSAGGETLQPEGRPRLAEEGLANPMVITKKHFKRYK